MNARGKKELIESLEPFIRKWMDEEDPNGAKKTDIGYIGDRTIKLMATIAITALELSAEAQDTVVREVREGLLSA